MSDVEWFSQVPPWEWGPDAGRILREVLEDGAADPEDRVLAAQMAGDLVVMDNRMAETLLGVLRSPDEPAELRGAAAIALGPVLEEIDIGFHDFDPEEAPVSEETERRIRRALHEVYLDVDAPVYVRRRALEASVRAPEEWHPSAVRAAYHGGDDAWRETAIFCMGCVPGFGDEILEALESEDDALFVEAVRAAGQWGIEAAWPHVRPLLVRPKGVGRSLLLAAIEAAPAIGRDAAEDALWSLADSDDDELSDAAYEAIVLSGALSDDDLDGWDEPVDGEAPPPHPHGNGSGGKRP